MDKKELSEKARKMVAGGALVLDVRTPDEFKGGHLDGARNIPVQELERRVKEVGDPKTSVVVYCASGMRSASAEQILRKHGFGDVLNLLSMSNW